MAQVAWQTRLAARLTAQDAHAVLFEASAAETVGCGLSTDTLLMDRVLLAPSLVVPAVGSAVLGSVLAGGGLFLVGWMLGVAGLLKGLVGLGLAPLLAAMQMGLQAYAPLLVVAAGVATVPYAVLLGLSGFLGVAPLWLLPAALLARSLRYGLLGALIWRSGLKYRDWLLRSYHGLTMVVALGLLLFSVFIILMVYTHGGGQ